ncbi:MAG TPA: MraY family glycosyltransferase [Segetibacter sp.]|jgi:UDP-N-acetylmuramyl pentapeptide phosphotransferase/UDP-N-acetylglucosamine-1-phosphate transferase
MEQIVIGGMLAFLATFYAIPVIIKVAEAKKLYDEPDDIRKLHTKPIPALGGLGIFIGFTLSILLTISFSSADAVEFQYYIAAILLIFFVGIKDDILVLSAMKKFMGQLFVAAILMFKAKLLITNMGGFLGFQTINETSSYFLTLFTIVVIINAFNLIDGVDGLAGGLGFVTSLVFGIFFLVNGNIPYAVLGFGFAGSVLAFLIYNFHPAKIFMGDTGSMLIGLVNSILVIKFIESGAGYASYPVIAAPAVGFAIMLLPLMDTLRVFGIRIIHGRSPFSPDRNHIHHLLMDKGMSHKNVTFTCIAVNGLFIAAGFLLQGIGTTFLIFGLIACFFSGIYVLYLSKTKVRMRVVKGDVDTSYPEAEAKRVRLVSIFNRAVAVDED